MKDLNVRAKTIKLFIENIGEKLHDIGFNNDFLDMTPKAQATQKKQKNLDSIKVKNFCALKDTINRRKRQPTEWEKTFANHISDKD